MARRAGPRSDGGLTQDDQDICDAGDVRRNGRHIRTVRVKIDRVDRIGLREARRRARELMSQIQSGSDPTSKPDETGITLKQALEIHLSERTFRPSTEGSYRYILDHQLVRFRRRAVADLTRADVRELFEEMKIKRGTTTAGGAMRVLRARVNTARGSTRPLVLIRAVRCASRLRRSAT